MIHIPLLAAALLLQAPRFDTDTTVSVPQGARLRIHNQGGDITIRTWERGQVRIQASHSSRSYVDVDLRGQVMELNSRGRRGTPSMVDYVVTVPGWMAVDLGGMYAEISIDGLRAPIKAQTLEGNIKVRGGTESVNLSTVNGTIDVAGARGRIELHSVAEDIHARDIQGELVAESVSGNLYLGRIDARSVEAQTVSGDIEFEGRLADAGTYSFVTHSGDVDLGIPENSNVTIKVATASGDVSSSFSLRPERETRRRQTYRMGNGSANLDIETFSGDVGLLRQSEVRPRSPEPEQRSSRSRRDRSEREPDRYEEN